MLNARSIATPGKMDNLRLSRTCLNPDIIIITESWLKDIHDECLFHMDGFSLFRCDRRERNGGGVVVWIRSRLRIFSARELHIRNVSEALSIVFEYNKRKYALLAIYVPPNLNSTERHEISDFVIDEIDNCIL